MTRRGHPLAASLPLPPEDRGSGGASPADRRPLRPMRRPLAGQRALVTGASSGVGRAVALELARRGCRVLATARRGDRLAELAEESRAAGLPHPIVAEAGDVTDDDFRRRLLAAAADRLGGLDLVVAAAGSGAIGPFREAAAGTFARIIDVDFIAPAELVRASLPQLSTSPDPGLVLVGSILALHPLPLHGEYCAAKAALRSLAGTLRTELAGAGVDVLLVSLGPTESEFWDNLLAGSKPPWSRGRRMPVEKAARAIVAGIERRRAEILPGWQAKGFAFAARYLPGLIDAIAARHLHGSPRPPAVPHP
jgi:short-subunit dehydrogenase